MQYDVVPMFSLALHADCGYERGELGNQSWYVGALYVQLKASSWRYFAARGDGIYEHVPRSSSDVALFFGGGDPVLSGTLTAEVRPIDGVSFRLEYRHDDSDDKVPLFFERGFDSTGAQRLSHAQNTLTLGMTGWF